jgi:hypothetical protein
MRRDITVLESSPRSGSQPAFAAQFSDARITGIGETRIFGSSGMILKDGEWCLIQKFLQQLFATATMILTNSQRWHNTPGGFLIPNSMYLTAKPAFFGHYPWPWVNPTTGATYTLPAKARYDAGTPFAVAPTGTHDFNGDGMSDILWKDTSGNTAAGLMNGGTIRQAGDYGALPGWSVTAIWFLNGLSILQIGGLVPTTSSSACTACSPPSSMSLRQLNRRLGRNTCPPCHVRHAHARLHSLLHQADLLGSRPPTPALHQAGSL